jgi:hypothetical protein
LVCEIARWDSVATGFGEEDGDVVALGVGVEGTVTGRLQVVISAPFVGVQTEEIDAL